MNEPLFSVVIPTYNRARDVLGAVECVLAQTWGDFDVWVIDDGSTDGTEQALERYRDSISYVKIPNGGHAAARNVGIERSTGRYVAFLDSDDRWHPEKLARYADVTCEVPDAGLLYSDVVIMSGDGERLWSQPARRVVGDGYAALLHGNFITMSSAIASRQALDVCGSFDTTFRLSPDWDLWIRIARRFPLAHVPHPVTQYSALGSDSQSADTSEDWTSELVRVIDKALAADLDLDGRRRRTIQAGLQYAIGRTQMLQGNRRGASAAFTRSVRLDPRKWRSLLYLALVRTRALGVLPRPLRRALRIP